MRFGKTALITGASRGIGRACALAFASEGYRIAAVYEKNEDAAKGLRELLRERGTDCEIYCCDVASHKSVVKAAEEVMSRFGHIDVLANNAGISQIKLFTDITEEDWDRMFDVNIKGIFNFCKAIVPEMISRKSGSIINISSMWGISGASCEVHYSASKSAVIGFTKALAKELGPSGIRVNCIAPGVIDTDMNSGLDELVMSELCGEIPLCRIGKAEKIAKAAVFLAGENASYITGQTISVDGGMII